MSNINDKLNTPNEMKPNTRVAIVACANHDRVIVLGYGTYLGDEAAPRSVLEKTRVGQMLMGLPEKFQEIAFQKAPPCAKILCDDGSVVWGYEPTGYVSEEDLKASGRRIETITREKCEAHDCPYHGKPLTLHEKYGVNRGERIGAIIESDSDRVVMLGYGVLMGEEIPPAEIIQTTKEGMLAALTGRPPRPTARLSLDTGEEAWGCQCHWGPEAKVRESLGTREVVTVSIADFRDGKIPPKRTITKAA
jgi:hypothetical protein